MVTTIESLEVQKKDLQWTIETLMVADDYIKRLWNGFSKLRNGGNDCDFAEIDPETTLDLLCEINRLTLVAKSYLDDTNREIDRLGQS